MILVTFNIFSCLHLSQFSILLNINEAFSKENKESSPSSLQEVQTTRIVTEEWIKFYSEKNQTLYESITRTIYGVIPAK